MLLLKIKLGQAQLGGDGEFVEVDYCCVVYLVRGEGQASLIQADSAAQWFVTGNNQHILNFSRTVEWYHFHSFLKTLANVSYL